MSKSFKNVSSIFLFKGPYCLNPRQSFQKNDINYYSLRKFYERDSAYLGLIEAFIQDGPQLVLQLYILAVRHHDDLSDPYTGKRQLINKVKSCDVCLVGRLPEGTKVFMGFASHPGLKVRID